jgi:hypothetical protein
MEKELPVERVFTKSITNTTFTVDKTMRLSMVRIECTTSTAGSILGYSGLPDKLNTLGSAVALVNGIPKVIVANIGRVLDGLLITAPSGCTLDIVGNIEP